MHPVTHLRGKLVSVSQTGTIVTEIKIFLRMSA